MSAIEKLLQRFKTIPSDFTFSELEKLLSYFGYERSNKGKTSGSRIIYKQSNMPPILIHKPHPGNIVKQYALKQIYDFLTKQNLLQR